MSDEELTRIEHLIQETIGKFAELPLTQDVTGKIRAATIAALNEEIEAGRLVLPNKGLLFFPVIEVTIEIGDKSITVRGEKYTVPIPE